MYGHFPASTFSQPGPPCKAYPPAQRLPVTNCVVTQTINPKSQVTLNLPSQQEQAD